MPNGGLPFGVFLSSCTERGSDVSDSSKAIQKQLNQRASVISGTGELARHGSDELKKTYEKHAADAMRIADTYTQLAAKAGRSPQATQDVTAVLAAQKHLSDGLKTQISGTLTNFQQASAELSAPPPAKRGFWRQMDDFANEVADNLPGGKRNH